jgi:transcriptional regulator with XRE-family HTH domain
MTVHPQFAQGATETQVLRQQAGRWLRALRERVGMSQKELAHAVGFDYYTFISQLESGRGRLPPGQYIAFSTALQIPLHEFVKTLLRYYDPLTYYALFDAEPSELDQSIPMPDEVNKASNENTVAPAPKSASNVAKLEERLAKLEALLSKLS